jgi:hypothetical protein
VDRIIHATRIFDFLGISKGKYQADFRAGRIHLAWKNLPCPEFKPDDLVLPDIISQRRTWQKIPEYHLYLF